MKCIVMELGGVIAALQCPALTHHPIPRSTSLASSWIYASAFTFEEFATPVVAVLEVSEPE